jgi:hypothetical protein
MRLSRALRDSAAAICIVSVAAPTVAVAPAQAAAGVEVRVARTRDFSRVEFRGVKPKVTREGKTVVFSFPRDADPDLARLRTSPPPWIKTAEARRGPGRLEVVVTLADDADARFGVADGATYLNAYPKADAKSAQPGDAAHAEAAPAGQGLPPRRRPSRSPSARTRSRPAAWSACRPRSRTTRWP